MLWIKILSRRRELVFLCYVGDLLIHCYSTERLASKRKLPGALANRRVLLLRREISVTGICCWRRSKAGLLLHFGDEVLVLFLSDAENYALVLHHRLRNAVPRDTIEAVLRLAYKFYGVSLYCALCIRLSAPAYVFD